LPHVTKSVPDYTPAQRAAKVTWQLIAREMAGLGGLTTEKIQRMLRYDSYQGAWKLMCQLCTGAMDGPAPVPFYKDEDEWRVDITNLLS